jgi:hypothetical protein
MLLHLLVIWVTALLLHLAMSGGELQSAKL